MNNTVETVVHRKIVIGAPEFAEDYFDTRYVAPDTRYLLASSNIARPVQKVIDLSRRQTNPKLHLCVADIHTSGSLKAVLVTKGGLPVASITSRGSSIQFNYACSRRAKGHDRYSCLLTTPSAINNVLPSFIAEHIKAVVSEHQVQLNSLIHKISHFRGLHSLHKDIKVPANLFKYIYDISNNAIPPNASYDSEVNKLLVEAKEIIDKQNDKDKMFNELMSNDMWVVSAYPDIGYVVHRGKYSVGNTNMVGEYIFAEDSYPTYAPTFALLPDSLRTPVMVKLKMLKAYREGNSDFKSPAIVGVDPLIPGGDKYYPDMEALTYSHAGVGGIRYPQYVVLA